MKVAKIKNCQNQKLPKLEIAKIKNYQNEKIAKAENSLKLEIVKVVDKLPKLKIDKLPKLPKLRIAEFLNCSVVKLLSC